MANLVLFNDIINRRLIVSPSAASGQPFALPAMFQDEQIPLEIYHLAPTNIVSSPYAYLDYTGAAGFRVGIGTPGQPVAAYTNSFTPTPAPSISVARLVAGAAGVNEQQIITINPVLVYGGFAVFGFSSALSPQLFYNPASPFFAAADLQTALQAISTIGTGNCTVQQLTAQSYLVTFVGMLSASSQPLISGDASNLVAPKGMVGTINLATSGIAALFGNNSQVASRFEIEVALTAGVPTKTLQAPVTLVEAVIDDATIIPPTALASYLTAAEAASTYVPLAPTDGGFKFEADSGAPGTLLLKVWNPTQNKYQAVGAIGAAGAEQLVVLAD